MTTGVKNPPQYSNKPVILVHVEVESLPLPGDLMRQPNWYWCANYEVVNPDEGAWPGIPRVPCPLCDHFNTPK